jgi:predicted secreted protein
MSKRMALLTAVALLSAAALPAGDIAAFVNLGFSDDGAYFQFAQYGVDSASGGSYAEIYTVDNARNAFAPKGVLRSSSSAPLDIGQDGSGIFYNLMYENSAQSKRYGIDHLRQGRLLYVLLDGEIPRQDLSFRDFKTGAEYSIALDQHVTEANGSVSSSFSLLVGVKDSAGRSRSMEGGTPGVKRPGVDGYLIRRAVLSPDERFLIVVVEKRVRAKDADSLRYMVEAVRLR